METQQPASFAIYPRIFLGIVAAYDKASAQARSRKPRGGIETRTSVRRNASRRSAAPDFVALCQRDGHSVGARDRQRSFADQLQHFIENELFRPPNFGIVGPRAIADPAGASLSDLLMKGRKSQ